MSVGGPRASVVAGALSGGASVGAAVAVVSVAAAVVEVSAGCATASLPDAGAKVDDELESTVGVLAGCAAALGPSLTPLVAETFVTSVGATTELIVNDETLRGVVSDDELSNVTVDGLTVGTDTVIGDVSGAGGVELVTGSSCSERIPGRDEEATSCASVVLADEASVLGGAGGALASLAVAESGIGMSALPSEGATPIKSL